MENIIKRTHFALYILLTAGLLSCSTVRNTTYKRYWDGEFMETQLCGNAKVIMKSNDNIILKDQSGWIEQTYYKPIVKRYEVGDVLYIKPCR